MRFATLSCLLVLAACASQPKAPAPAAVPPPAATSAPPAQPAPQAKPTSPAQPAPQAQQPGTASTSGGTSQSTQSTESKSGTPATVSNTTQSSDPVDPELARVMKTHTKVVRDGKILYCRRDASMGSRITTTKCFTETQLEDEVRRAAEAKRKLGLPRSGPCSSTGAAC
jgi:hypothetical protein